MGKDVGGTNREPASLGRRSVGLAQVYRARVTLANRDIDNKTADVLPFSVVVAAREASLRGDSSACLELLDGIAIDEGLEAEVLFLRGRALLRLQRPKDAAALLEPSLSAFADVDENYTVRMLHAHAVARSDETPERGLRLLAVIAGEAADRKADRAIRAEIAYYRAMAHWSMRQYVEAARFANEVERAHIDVLSVRATQLRAFIALGCAKYPEALALFRRAHFAYGSCRGRDIDLATQILLQIANLEQVLRSSIVPGSHAIPGGRSISGISWGPAVATPARMLLAYSDAWLFALDGDHRTAFRKARETDELAPSAAWRVWALACRAIIAVMFGELAAGRDFGDTAFQLQVLVDWDATADEERIGLLQLAEAFAYLDPDTASAVVLRYDSISSTMDSQRLLRNHGGDPRIVGAETYLRGLIARGRGDFAKAGELLRSSVQTFHGCGYLWREALALIELDATPAETRGNLYLETAATIIRENFPRSFLAHRLGRWARIYFDPVATTLTPAQRDVLRHLLGGLNPQEIAARTNRSAGTVGQHVKRIHAAFGTHSVGQLFHECHRRGLGAPTWRNDQDATHAPFGWVATS